MRQQERKISAINLMMNPIVTALRELGGQGPPMRFMKELSKTSACRMKCLKYHTAKKGHKPKSHTG